MIDHIAFLVAAKDGGQIKAEPIDMHLGDPVAQGGEDEFYNDGVIGVNGVVATSVVGKISFIIEDKIGRIYRSSRVYYFRCGCRRHRGSLRCLLHAAL